MCIRDRRIHQAAIAEIGLDRLSEKTDKIQSFLGKKDERYNYSNENRTGNPEKALSQLLEVIEERHLRLGSNTRLRHGRQPNTRSRSRASSASSDDGYFW